MKCEELFNDCSLAIIGTAGRRDDSDKLTLIHWYAMLGLAKYVIADLEPNKLISGGAAWADHIAVELHLQTNINLELYLPSDTNDVNISRHYHGMFSRAIGRNSLDDIASLNENGIIQRQGTFLHRNKIVAKRATHFLAFTFGDGDRLRDGGTNNTVKAMQAMKKWGWHVDLNTFKIYQVNP